MLVQAPAGDDKGYKFIDELESRKSSLKIQV